MRRTSLRIALVVVFVGASVSSFVACGSSDGTDGRYFVFDSNATDLVPGDTNGEWDVFVRDRVDGTTERVSVGLGGRQSDGESGLPSITADGRVVAFWSSATNLVAGDTNRSHDVFVYDRSTKATERASVAGSGAQANGKSTGPFPALSADGRYVAFESLASNLVAGDANGGWDVFVRDRVEGTTERVTLSGTQDNGASHGLAISADGRYVAFQSSASNLVLGDTNGSADVFVRDREKRTTERVSVGPGIAQGDGESGFPSLSADGRYVAFESEADLVAGDTNDRTDAFVRDRDKGTTELASVPDPASEGYGGMSVTSDAPSLSASGRYVMFWSGEGSNQPGWEVFVRDRTAETTELVSIPVGAAQAGRAVVEPHPGDPGRPLAVTVTITVDSGPASSATVACSAALVSGTSAVVTDVPLPASGGRYRDGAAECRWTLPPDSGGKTVRGVVTATTPNGRVWRSFEAPVAGEPGTAAPVPDARAGTILFTRSVGKRTKDLYTVAPDGSAARLFVRDASGAAVSRDGRRILFVRGGAIWLMARDGSGQRQVTRPARTVTDWDPAWSPDGRTLYFSRDVGEGGGYAIFSIRLDGSGLRRLTPGCDECSVGGEDEAAPSPDGRVVAYSYYYHGGGEDSGWITAMTPTGRNARLGFATTNASHHFSPAWAPDGRSLAFEAFDYDALSSSLEGQVGLSGIYVSRAAGTGSPRRVARPNRDPWKRLGDPAWSADGRWLAFTQEHEVGYESVGNIWLVRADGGALRRLTAGNVDTREPTWLGPPR